MIITQTPYRISFFGGGTDYPTWFREYGGAVLSSAINKYCYISCRNLPPFFEHKHRIVYSQIESVKEIADIKHPAVRAVLEQFNQQEGIEIHHDGDLPARSGIGSSSSFTVGMLKTMYAVQGRMVSKYDLAREAIHIEQNVIGEAVGSQDQIAAAYGGINKISFHQDNTFTVDPIIITSDRIREFNSNLLLFFTGFSRTAAVVAKTKIDNMPNKKRQLMVMKAFVDEGITILQNERRSLDEIGTLLHESWKLKRELSDKVTTNAIDDIYQAGLDAGAVGGKILGAGGGGFALFYVRPENQAAVREKLKNLIEVNFAFDYQGSRIALYDPSFGINTPLQASKFGSEPRAVFM